ncbi:MAG: N-acetyl-gamma-glutamyl-phosphate reductase, partial [Candidatus Nanopelagicales bacterium]
MTWKAAIAGASGYAGGELLRLLSGHPEFEIGQVSDGGSAGQSVGDLHPHLPHLADRVFVPASGTQWLDHDFVFMALPHGQSAGLVAQLPDSLPVVDLGADYRLRDRAAWNDYYGGAYAGSWVYGLPELAEQRSPIAASHHVANPGCYPTAVTLSVAPLLAAGLVDGSDVVVVAASGTSGGGRGAKPASLGADVMGSVSAYKAAGSHQHTPEME